MGFKDNKVLSLVKKDAIPNYVEIVYKNGDKEERRCDFLGMSEAIPGFLYIGNDSEVSEDYFVNLEEILKVKTIVRPLM